MRREIILSVLMIVFLLQPLLCELKSESAQVKKEQEEIKHEVVVVLKLVQVYVTDKEGNPVTDLTKDDFILYDNGKLQKITDFEKHILFRPEAKVEEKVEEKVLPTRLKTPPRMNRKFFLIIDFQRNSKKGFKASKQAALYFMNTQVQPSDEVGVLTFTSITGLDLHQYLTTDHQKVREVIKGLKRGIESSGTGRGGRVSPLEGERARAEEEAGLGQESEIASLLIQPFRGPGMSHIVRRPVDFAQEIKEMAIALRYIPGYKNIIFFSAGFARSMFRDNWYTPFPEKYEEMSKELATSSCPVYTVNSMEKQAHFGGRERMGEYSLKLLSELSGGKYFDDVNQYETIAREIQNITSNYYVLGYYIDEKWDGQYHEIEVQVKREGYNVYAQGGFFNPKFFTELSDFEKQLHLIDLALSENPYFQKPLRFPLAALPCSDKKKSNLVLLSEIQLDEISDIIKQKTEIVTLIFDRENSVVDSSQGEINFSTIPQNRIYHYTISSLEPGEYECRMVIRNLKTGKGAVASSSVVIPESLDSGIRLYPPLLLIPKEGFYLRASKAQKKDLESEPLSLINIYPFLSNEYSPLIEELEQRVSRLLAVVRCSFFNIQNPDVELSAHLELHPSGEEIPLSLSILSAKHEKETDVLLIEFELPDLEPGQYTLNIVGEETTTNASSQVSRIFRVIK